MIVRLETMDTRKARSRQMVEVGKRRERPLKTLDFSMKVLESFQSAMARQVNEGVRIKRSKADCMMNSKSEFHQHPVVRVVPMRGIQQEQGEEQRGGRGRGQRGRGQRRQGQ